MHPDLMFSSLEQRAWHEAVVFVRQYVSITDEPAQRWVEASMLAPDALGLLTAYGYLEGFGSRIRPSFSAYDAEFADRLLPRIRTLLGAMGYDGTIENEPGADLTPLVAEGWLERANDRYAVTPRGRAALERVVSMHRSS